MAIAATTVFEVRATGSDSNGGGFNAARGGTDYTLQDAAQAAGTATVSGTTLTATTGLFTSAMVGNLVTDGTSWREITAFTSATVVTIDATVSWTAASIAVGGALLTIAKALGVMVQSNTCYVKTGTYSTSAGLTLSVGSYNAAKTNLIGYGSARGDGGQPTIQATAGSIAMLTLSGSGIQAQNFVVDGNGQASVRGVAISGTYDVGVSNLLVKNCNNGGIVFSGTAGGLALACEVTACSSAAAISGSQGGCSPEVSGCYIHDNTATAISGSISVVDCLIANNTGATSDAINLTGFDVAVVRNNTIHGNGRHGIYASVYGIHGGMSNNVITSNGGYGLNWQDTAASQDIRCHHNAFYLNTSGARNLIAAGVGDVTLTGDPYVNAASKNFALNTTAGAGAACRAAGSPGVFPAGTTTGYPDIGAAQHQDPAATTNIIARRRYARI